MIAAGKPTVVLATEAFGKLVKASLAARKTPEALAILIEGNPELFDEASLDGLADRLFDEAAIRLTGGAGTADGMVA